ncbi:NAD(P)H-binding protein [Haloechinothrix sp. LS1_15]|nr:NAD(P)H-binding protein [Haloechinothrix sp. LS1_15]
MTVMGATGRTGGEVTRRMLDAGVRVRAVGRSASKLAELEAAGAEPLCGDAGDAGFLAGTFQGATAAYVMLPFEMTWSDAYAEMDRIGEAIVTAAREARLPYLVALSSLGADRPSGTGLIVGLHRQEQRLRSLRESNVLLLRPGMFYETFDQSVELIERHGAHYDAVAPDVPLPMVSTRDIGAEAARALLERDWQDVAVREILGQRDLSYAEATRILAERLGREGVGYVQVPYRDMAEELIRQGASTDVARLYIDMVRAFNEGRVTSLEGRGPASITPTPFEEFADELVGRLANQDSGTW